MQALLLDTPEKIDYSYLDTISIVDVVERTGTHLTRSGSTLTALCPLHNDKHTLSFRVYEKTNSWACFSPNCGNGDKTNGGRAIEFIKQRYGFTFKESVDWLERNFVFNPVKIERKEPEKKQVKTVITPDLILYWHGSLGSKREFFYKRGFTDRTIDTQLLGYDAATKRYTIPVWDWQPGQSEVIGVRKRKQVEDKSDSPKYIGMTGANTPVVYGKYSCLHKNLILAFAGELDCLRAIQDGMPAFSVVNGVNSFRRFPDDWPNVWFKDSTKLAVCFDKREEIVAGQLATVWNKSKGSFSARVFHYPLNFSGKDYCDWRDSGRTAQEFYERVLNLF
jgi:hypothetical protein